MKAYLRFDPLVDESKAHYTPAQFGAFVKIVALAGRQRERGRFHSQDALRRMLPPAYARHVVFLVAEGDVIELSDGRVYLDGWDEWQEGDMTVPERMARLRDKRRNDVTDATVTDRYVGVSSSVGVSTSGATAPSPRESDDGRFDLEAFLLVKRRAPTAAQRNLLDKVGDRRGFRWAADIMLANPHDPIGAVIEADKRFLAERIAVADAQEAESASRRRQNRTELPPAARELVDHWRRQEQPADPVA